MSVSVADGARVGLLGVGRDAMAILDAGLAAANRVVAVVDDLSSVSVDTTRALERMGVRLASTKEAGAEGAEPIDLFIRSPGFPVYRPDVQALTAGIEMTNSLQLWFDTEHGDQPVVFVTGTKGKSTVAAALGSMVRDSMVLGNIGVSPWSEDPGRLAGARVLICEISSYQAIELDHRADLAVLTSLGEDHLDWHGSVEQYRADKLRPVRRAREVVVPADDAVALSAVSDLPHVTACSESGVLAELSRGSSVHRLNLTLAECAAERLRETHGTPVVRADEWEEPVLRSRFERLASEASFVAIDDALASNPRAAAAAVEECGDSSLAILVGGADRGVDFTDLVEAMKRRARDSRTAVVLLPGDARDRLDHAFGSMAGLSVLRVDGLASAVVSAAEWLGDDGVLLFSPACPTMPADGNWLARSEAFRIAVQALTDGGSDD